MQAGRRLSKGLGGAAVGFIHHVSKEAARNNFTDQHAGRGGSAFADNSRAMLVMNAYTEGKDGDKPPKGLLDEDPLVVEDSRLIQLNVAKYSYGPRNPRPYWIVRGASNAFDLTVHIPPTAQESKKEKAKAVQEKKHKQYEERQKYGAHSSGYQGTANGRPDSQPKSTGRALCI